VTSAAGARFELRIGTAEFVAASVTAGTAVTRLLPCVPNPVRTDATVRFDLARTGPVTLELFDIAGRRVTTLARGPHAAGRHELAWTPRDGAGHALAPGVYALRLVADGRSDVRRLVVSR
jgi:hypothetical protein